MDYFSIFVFTLLGLIAVKKVVFYFLGYSLDKEVSKLKTSVEDLTFHKMNHDRKIQALLVDIYRLEQALEPIKVKAIVKPTKRLSKTKKK